jgi:hypothetical protein
VVTSTPGSGEVNLHRLDDVDYDTVKFPANNQVLTYSSSLGKWYAANSSGGGGSGVSLAVFNLALANTNLSINNVKTNLTSTNTALRILISDRLQVANAAAIYQTKVIERAALANTNSYIATRSSWAALTSTNTAIRQYVDTSVAALVNSAPTTLNTLKELATALGDDSNFSTTITTLIGSKASNNYVNQILANTNLSINNVKTNLTSTNTTLRTLIGGRLQVSNSFSSLTVRSSNTASVTTKQSDLTLNSAIVANPAGHFSIVISGTTYKIPYFL